jgi:hypothetical protein
VTAPGGSTQTLTLAEIQPGVFEVGTVLSVAGVYRLHVVANGVTLRGVPFTREQVLTAAAFLGGDDPLPTTTPKPEKNPLCCLLGCLIKEKSVCDFMKSRRLDPEAIGKCIEKCCHQG